MFLRSLARIGVPVKVPPQVAVVRLNGVIQASSNNPSSGGINLARFDNALQQSFGLAPAASLQAVALVINSPGGSPVQSSLVYRRVRQLHKRTNEERSKKKLPPVKVLAFVEDVAASGGYYIAAAAEEIIVDPSSIVGSIGVVGGGFGFVGLLEKLGVERRIHTSGLSKSQMDPFQPLKDSDVRAYRRLLETVHAEFKGVVVESRGARLAVDEAAARAAAVGQAGDGLFDGSVYTGRDAVELGLADAVGTLAEECQQRFGTKVQLRDFTPKPSLFSAMGGGYGASTAASQILSALGGGGGGGAAAGYDEASAQVFARGLVDAALERLHLETLRARSGGIWF
jgi:signal peptide peptidase SppA